MTDSKSAEDAWEHLRLFTELWIAEHGDKGFLPRIGRIPSLAVADLRDVVKSWEDTHLCAVAVYTSNTWDLKVLRTFASEEKAQEFLEVSGGPGAFIAYWDDNGQKSCWRERRDWLKYPRRG